MLYLILKCSICKDCPIYMYIRLELDEKTSVIVPTPNMHDQFYVTLPSSTRLDFYPDNTVTHFTTHLDKPIELGDTPYEVSLCELHLRGILDHKVPINKELFAIQEVIPILNIDKEELEHVNVSPANLHFTLVENDQNSLRRGIHFVLTKPNISMTTFNKLMMYLVVAPTVWSRAAKKC